MLIQNVPDHCMRKLVFLVTDECNINKDSFCGTIRSSWSHQSKCDAVCKYFDTKIKTRRNNFSLINDNKEHFYDFFKHYVIRT